MANLCPPLHTSEWSTFEKKFENMAHALYVWKHYGFEIPTDEQLNRDFRHKIPSIGNITQETHKEEFQRQYDEVLPQIQDTKYPEHMVRKKVTDLQIRYDNLYFETIPITVTERDRFSGQVRWRPTGEYRIIAKDKNYFPGIKMSIGSVAQNMTTNNESVVYTDKITGEKALRNTEFLLENFDPDYDKNSKYPKEYQSAIYEAKKLLRKNNLDDSNPTDPDNRYVLDDTRPNDIMSFTELVTYKKKMLDDGRNIGRVMHAYLRYFATSSKEVEDEYKSIEEEMGLSEEDKARYREIAKKFYDNNVVGFLDGKDFAFELVVMLPGLEMAFNDGTNDIKGSVAGALDTITGTHREHVYNLIDYKTGPLNRLDDSHGKIRYSTGEHGHMTLYNNSYNMAMLKVVLNAMQFKGSVDRDAKFEDIALWQMSLKNKASGKDCSKYSLMSSDYKGVTNELSKYLFTLESFFKENHYDYWRENKDLFVAENYIAPIEKKRKTNKGSYRDELMVRLNTLIDKRNHIDEDAEENVKLNKDIKLLIDEISQDVTGNMPRLTSMSKGIHLIEAWTLGIQDKSHPLIKVINRLYGERSFGYNKERNLLTQEYKRRLEKVQHKTAFHVGADYKDIYGFLWNKTNDNEENLTKGGEYLTTWKDAKWKDLTQEERDFANYHRWFLRYQLFSTMSPQHGVAYILKELDDRKDLSQEDIDMLKGQVELLSQMPDINKFANVNMSYFVNNYKEGWTPRIQRQPEEAKNIVEHIKNIAKNTWQMSPDDLASMQGDKETQGYIGLPVKYMGGRDAASKQSEKYTYNPEIIAASFMDGMMKKRYFDDVHNLSIAMTQIINQLNEVKKSKQLSNMSTFIEGFADQIAGKRANELNVWSKRIIAVKNLVGFSSLALRMLAPIRTGLGQELNVLTRTIAGSISKVLANRMGIDKSNIDVSFGNATKITGNIVKYQKDLIYNRESLDRNKTHFFSNIMGNTVESYNYSSFDKGKMSSTMSFLTGKKITNNGLYFMYRIWDIITYSQYMEHQLMNMKVPTKDGKGTMSMYDAYQYNEKTHTFEYQGGVRGKTKDGRVIAELTAEDVMAIKKVSRDALGGMRNEERPIAENSLLGMLFFQFKWFFPGMMNAAWKKKQTNATLIKWMNTGEYFISDENHKDYNATVKRYKEDGKTETELYRQLEGEKVQMLPVLYGKEMIDEGYFKTLFTVAMMLKLRLKDKPKFDAQWEELSDYQKQNIILAGTKLAMYLGLGFLIGMAFGGGGGDDDKDFLNDKGNKWAYNLKSLRDQYMFEAVFTDLDGMSNTLQSSASVGTSIKFLSGLYEFGGALLYGEHIQSGPHEGWYKGLPKIVKYTPGISTFYDAWRTEWDYKEMEKNWFTTTTKLE